MDGARGAGGGAGAAVLAAPGTGAGCAARDALLLGGRVDVVELRAEVDEGCGRGEVEVAWEGVGN